MVSGLLKAFVLHSSGHCSVSLRITFLTPPRFRGIDAPTGWRSTERMAPSLAAEGVRRMSSRKLVKFALYALQAVLWSGAILIGLAILGGLAYLHDASKHAFSDVQSEILLILRNEIIFIGVATTLLFWIGTIRTYMARNREGEQRKLCAASNHNPFSKSDNVVLRAVAILLRVLRPGSRLPRSKSEMWTS